MTLGGRGRDQESREMGGCHREGRTYWWKGSCMGSVALSTYKWLRPPSRLHPKMLVNHFSTQLSYLLVSSRRDGRRKERTTWFQQFFSNSIFLILAHPCSPWMKLLSNFIKSKISLFYDAPLFYQSPRKKNTAHYFVWCHQL